MLPQVNEGDLLQLGALMDDNTVAPSVPSQPLTLASLFNYEETAGDPEYSSLPQVQTPTSSPESTQLRLMSGNPEEEGDHICYMRGQYRKVPKPERLLNQIVPRDDGKGYTYLALDTASSLIFCDKKGEAEEAYTGIE